LRRPWLPAVIGLLVLAALALLVAVYFGLRPARQPPPPTPPVQPPAANAPEAARHAVVSYMKHLQAGDYAAAHRLLTAESRQRHPLAEFERLARQGVTLYDLSSARAKLVRPDRAEVTIHLEGDPAEATIIAARRDGSWYVVYLRGRPGFPYP